MELQEVDVTSVESSGTLLCRAKANEVDVETYLEFLATMNTHYENRKQQNSSLFLPEIGQLCACYTSVGDSPKLWYRGRIIEMYRSTYGLIGKLLLVDEGRIVCVTKQRMRHLSEDFLSYPHQVVECVLHEIIPITLGTSLDLNMSLQKAVKWDTAAISFLENLVKDASIAVQTLQTDKQGKRHVILFKKDEHGSWLNVNNLLIKENYAALKNINSEVLSKQNFLPVKNKPIENALATNAAVSTPTKQSKTKQANAADSRDEVNYTSMTLESYRQDTLKKQKGEQQRKIDEQANRNMQELLQLLGDDSASKTPTRHGESSGTSDLSDMETTPVPEMISFKQSRKSKHTLELLNDKFDKETSDLITKSFGLTPQKETSNDTPKKVSFSPHDEVYNIQTKEGDTSSKPFDFAEQPISHSGAKPKSQLVDATFLFKALSAGEPSLTSRQSFTYQKYSPVKDVLVYGKLQRESFADLADANLPMPLKSNLCDIGFKNPTPFQLHMWPAFFALRNIVGITDTIRDKRSKILSYALPLVKNLISQAELYHALGKGNGPYAVICVAKWDDAQLVYDVFEKLTGYYKKNVKIDLRYGGMNNQEERNIRLLNGCHVLIVTVPSLNALIKANFTNLNRVQHIIFDDADILVDKFTEDIKVLMRNYAENLKKQSKVSNDTALNCMSQIVAIGTKWCYGINSLMKSYMTDPMIIIANKIEAALFIKVPIAVELCSSIDRLDHLVGFLETDAVDENTIIFTNSAKTADDLRENLAKYSVCANVISDFTSPTELKDTRQAWNSALKTKNNVLIMSENAVLNAGIQNASCVVHYDYPQKRIHFGNRLGCMLETIRDNEFRLTPLPLLSHVFVTEQDNGMRYSTALVKLLERSGQTVPDLLQTMALSSRELKEEQKQFYELCPRLKLFGECSFIEDCAERHTIFPDRDLIGLCPSTGFIKVIILDVISASNFWGRIVEHRLPYDPNNTAYDTSVYLKLSMDLQLHYANPNTRKLCCTVEKYDIGVVKTSEGRYERVRVMEILEKEMERPKTLQVFGIDNGFTMTLSFDKLLLCADQFKVIPPQAVEIIASCVKPVENGLTWTHQASREIERKVLGKTLEGRVQFSLQNTMWIDPLVEKEMLSGIQSKTYSLDVGRDLLRLGFADKNHTHIENLRKLLYDVQGHPMELSDATQSLPIPMIEHETAYLHDDDYENVYVSAVDHPGLFHLQRAELCDTINKLDDKIDATMCVKKIDPDLACNMFPIGYICVAQYSGNKRWYRAKVLGISADQKKYDIFFVDHGDREWREKSKVAPAWIDILSLPFQAIECSFKKINPTGDEWTSADGDVLYDITVEKILCVKVVKTTASTHKKDTINYEVELYDTTGEENKYISHELVLLGVAYGSSECLQEMFPHSSIGNATKEYKVDLDKCSDLCVEIHVTQDLETKIEKAKELHCIIGDAPEDNTLFENGSLQSICKLLALSKLEEIQSVLMQCLQVCFQRCSRSFEILHDNELFRTLCHIMQKTSSDEMKHMTISSLLICVNDPWYYHVLHDLGLMEMLCDILKSGSSSEELIQQVLDALTTFCSDNESNCTVVRQEDGLEALCKIYRAATNDSLLEKCALAFKVLLASTRNQDRMRENGGLQDLSCLNKNLNQKALLTMLQTLMICIKENKENREHLRKVDAHLNIKRVASLQVFYSRELRFLFNKIINTIGEDDRENNIVIPAQKEILPVFKERAVIEDEERGSIKARFSPHTAWSQHRRTVTLSIRLRGVKSERTETQFYPERLYFRTVLKRVEYTLDLDLYGGISTEESTSLIKGGEVLITLRKEDTGEEWSRLTKSTDKLPYIITDFERLDNRYYDEVVTETSEGDRLFMPGLPPPPKCTAYDPNTACLLPYDASLSDDDESDTSSEEELEGYGEITRDDYFKI